MTRATYLATVILLVDPAEFAAIEADVFERIREIKARTETEPTVVDDEHRVAGVEITVDDDAS